MICGHWPTYISIFCFVLICAHFAHSKVNYQGFVAVPLIARTICKTSSLVMCWADADAELVRIVKARATVEMDALIPTQSATHSVSQLTFCLTLHDTRTTC